MGNLISKKPYESAIPVVYPTMTEKPCHYAPSHMTEKSARNSKTCSINQLLT